MSQSNTAANLMLIVNLGGEMLYILEHRLRSYSVDVVKTEKVLQDLVVSMLDKVEAINPTEAIFTRDQIQQLFYKFAHSSVMRLTETGLQKLVELMIMSFKYQLFACSYPLELFFISQNHMEAWEKHGQKLRLEPRLLKLKTRLENLGDIGGRELCVLRQDLNDVFTKCGTKVSQFIAWGIQSSKDGSFIHRPNYKGFSPIPGDFKEYRHLNGTSSEFKTILGKNMFTPDAGLLFDITKPTLATIEKSESAFSSTSSIDSFCDLDHLKDLITFRDESKNEMVATAATVSEEKTPIPVSRPVQTYSRASVVKNNGGKQLQKDMAIFDSALTIGGPEASLLDLMDTSNNE
ncbi:Protein oscp1 [Dinochytrium kinnereticum]|nr:Protein oscp1 [Dinochytrium kinnereticum]